jgi:hypothetical protein
MFMWPCIVDIVTVKNQLDATEYAVLLPQHVSGTNMPITHPVSTPYTKQPLHTHTHTHTHNQRTTPESRHNIDKIYTMEPRFTNAPVHEQIFRGKKRLGWQTVSRITNTQVGNRGKLRVSARERQLLVN